MNFTATDIRTFKRLYEEHFNIKLNDKIATLKLAMLVRQIEIVYRPLTYAQLNKLNDYENEFDEKRAITR